MTILQEGVRANLFRIDPIEQDLEVFLYSIGYVFPLPTTEQYYEPSEEKLLLVIDWFIKQWSFNANSTATRNFTVPEN